MSPAELLAEARKQQAAGQDQAAELSWRALCEAAPDAAEPPYWLATFLMEKGRNEEAIEPVLLAVSRAPASEPIRYRWGQILYRLGRYGEALRTFQPLLQNWGGEADLLLMVSQCAVVEGRPSLAVSLLHPVLTRFAEIPAIQAIYAQACGHLGASAEARAAFERALALDNRPSVRLPYASFLLNEGDIEAARTQFEQLQPSLPIAAETGLTQVDERAGNRTEARARLSRLVAVADDEPNIAMAIGATSRSPEELVEARELLDRALLRRKYPAERRLLLYRRGDVRHRQADYAGAWEDWTSAHQQEEPRFDPVAHHRWIDACIATFSGELPRSNRVGPSPIYIVGLPRSGTSLVEQILASHPMVFGGGERGDIQHLEQKIPGGPAGISSLLPSQLTEAADRIWTELCALAPPGTQRITDKLPDNFLRLGLISLLFPNVRVIHCRRSPMDTALSCYQQPWGAGLGWNQKLEWIGLYYLEYRRLMAAWHRLLPIPILDLDYELLVQSPKAVIPLLTEFCGLPEDPRCLEPHKNARVVATASYDQVRQPIHGGSVGRWRAYASQLEPLRAMLQRNGVAAGPG